MLIWFGNVGEAWDGEKYFHSCSKCESSFRFLACLQLYEYIDATKVAPFWVSVRYPVLL